MSIVTKYAFDDIHDKGYQVERCLRVVRSSVDPVVLIYDDDEPIEANRLLFAFNPDTKSRAEAVARAILTEGNEL